MRCLRQLPSPMSLSRLPVFHYNSQFVAVFRIYTPCATRKVPSILDSYLEREWATIKDFLSERTTWRGHVVHPADVPASLNPLIPGGTPHDRQPITSLPCFAGSGSLSFRVLQTADVHMSAGLADIEADFLVKIDSFRGHYLDVMEVWMPVGTSSQSDDCAVATSSLFLTLPPGSVMYTTDAFVVPVTCLRCCILGSDCRSPDYRPTKAEIADYRLAISEVLSDSGLSDENRNLAYLQLAASMERRLNSKMTVDEAFMSRLVDRFRPTFESDVLVGHRHPGASIDLTDKEIVNLRQTVVKE